MKALIMDTLQWAFDRAYGLVPRQLSPQAVEPLLVGHRGVYEHPEVRENTLTAFDLAVHRGGGIEFDLHLTRDHVLVVHHDPTLARVHGVDSRIDQLTLAQLQEVAPAVPTLDEVLDRYGHCCPHYFLEPKVSHPDDMRRLAGLLGENLQRRRLTGCSTLLSSDSAMLDMAREVVPWLAKVMVFFVDYRSALRYIRQHGDTGLAGWYFTYPGGERSALEQRGLHIGVGQIDYPNTHRHLSNRGYRYQFTNRIDRLVQPLQPLRLPERGPALVGSRP
jgi:glycerophosphoryl diester phosphodiesterase